MPRIALISPDPSFRTLLRRCLNDVAPSAEWVLSVENGVAGLRPESVDKLLVREPNLLFIDVGDSPGHALRFISAVTSRAPELTVVAAGNRLGEDELLQVIRAGASEYLRRPFDPDDVADACARILRRVGSAPARTGGEKARTVALFSPKGGAGVSTIATNLAIHIRKVTDKKTLLLDLSPGLGSCAVLMGLEPRYSHLDVIESLHRMDQRLLHSFLEEHDSGTRLIASPTNVKPDRNVSAEDVHSVVRLARRHFDYVVIDVGRRVVDPAAMKVSELADDTLVVTTPELPTLRAVKRVLPHLSGQNDRDPENVRLIVNRYLEGEGVSRKDIEQAVGAPVYHVLKEDTSRVTRSINLGQPIVMNGSSPYAKGVKTLGNRIAGDDLLEKDGGSRIVNLVRTILPPYGRNGKKTDR